MAHLWAKWLRHPCPLGDPHRLRAGGRNQRWPTCGQCGYVTPTVSGIPTAAERGAKSEVAHLWAKGLRHPCRLGDPRRCRAGAKIRSGPLMGKVAPSPLPSRGSPPLRSGGRGGSEVSHFWAKWLRHPCPLGDPHRFRAGGEIRGGPLVGSVATSPLPSRGSPPLQSGGGNQKWPTCGPSGYVTPATSGIPTASQRGENQKWPTCGQSGYVTPAVSGIPTASERGGGDQKWPKQSAQTSGMSPLFNRSHPLSKCIPHLLLKSLRRCSSPTQLSPNIQSWLGFVKSHDLEQVKALCRRQVAPQSSNAKLLELAWYLLLLLLQSVPCLCTLSACSGLCVPAADSIHLMSNLTHSSLYDEGILQMMFRSKCRP